MKKINVFFMLFALLKSKIQNVNFQNQNCSNCKNKCVFCDQWNNCFILKSSFEKFLSQFLFSRSGKKFTQVIYILHKYPIAIMGSVMGHLYYCYEPHYRNGSNTYRGALSTQCAAVITILSFIIDPPQKWIQSSLLKHM